MKIGDYKWSQLSMWEFAPKNCIEKFVTTESGKHVLHFYLTKVSDIVSNNHCKVETVTDPDKVPQEILNWRNDNYNKREE